MTHEADLARVLAEALGAGVLCYSTAPDGYRVITRRMAMADHLGRWYETVVREPDGAPGFTDAPTWHTEAEALAGHDAMLVELAAWLAVSPLCDVCDEPAKLDAYDMCPDCAGALA